MSVAPAHYWQAITKTREFALIVFIALIAIAMTVASPHFLTLANFRAMGAGLVPTGVIVVGMAYLLVSGGESPHLALRQFAGLTDSVHGHVGSLRLF